LKSIAGNATGGRFLRVGTGTSRSVLYVGCEDEGGLVANNLREALALMVGVHDATAFPVQEDGGLALRDCLARAADEIRQNRPELAADRDRLRKALGLPPLGDALLRSLQTRVRGHQVSTAQRVG
jgi:hypothetical protein